MNNSTSRKRGFTLVEIMIVVAIIGLLAAVAIPNLVKAKRNAQVNGCKANLGTIEFAISQWALEKRKADDVEVSLEELEEYFKDGIPRCPSGGDYELTTVAEKPTCTIEGHTLSQEEEEEEEERRPGPKVPKRDDPEWKLRSKSK